jgi:hypothetical protein
MPPTPKPYRRSPERRYLAGYDYSRLASSVDAIELYHYGDNIEMVGSFDSDAIMITTSFRGGPAEIHRIRRELLRRSRGLILWDEKNEFVAKDGTVGDRRPRNRARVS